MSFITLHFIMGVSLGIEFPKLAQRKEEVEGFPWMVLDLFILRIIFDTLEEND